MSQSGQESNDRELIQRLVDGELEHPLRSQWLSSVAADSPLWRELALAFVERQLFDEALGALVSDDQPATRVKEVGEREKVRTNNDSRSRSFRVSWIAGLAASLLIGFLTGGILYQGTDSTGMRIEDPAPLNAAMESRGAETQRSDSIGLADALSRSVAPVPNEFRRALRKAGYSLRDRQTITNVSLPSGGQIEMPVRHVDVEFIGISTFQ
jgi:hypothetical protein